MSWQDTLIAVGQVLFIIALVPALLGSSKPPRFTCLLTGGVLAAFAVAFGSLSLWWGSWSAAVCALCWFILLCQARPGYRFIATHRHAEGGLYRLLGYVQVHVAKDTWASGVHYRSEDQMEFVRTLADFNERFTNLSEEQ